MKCWTEALPMDKVSVKKKRKLSDETTQRITQLERLKGTNTLSKRFQACEDFALWKCSSCDQLHIAFWHSLHMHNHMHHIHITKNIFLECCSGPFNYNTPYNGRQNVLWAID